jgi:hypothetical protein
MGKITKKPQEKHNSSLVRPRRHQVKSNANIYSRLL